MLDGVDERPEFQSDLTYVDGIPILALYCIEQGYGAATMLEAKEISEYMANWCLRMMEIMRLESVFFLVDPAATTKGLAERLHRR